MNRRRRFAIVLVQRSPLRSKATRRAVISGRFPLIGPLLCLCSDMNLEKSVHTLRSRTRNQGICTAYPQLLVTVLRRRNDISHRRDQ